MILASGAHLVPSFLGTLTVRSGLALVPAHQQILREDPGLPPVICLEDLSEGTWIQYNPAVVHFHLETQVACTGPAVGHIDLETLAVDKGLAHLDALEHRLERKAYSPALMHGYPKTPAEDTSSVPLVCPVEVSQETG